MTTENKAGWKRRAQSRLAVCPTCGNEYCQADNPHLYKSVLQAVNSFDAMKGALRSFIAHEKMVCRSEEIGGCIGALIFQGEAALALAERGEK